MTIPAPIATVLSMAANNNGFEQELGERSGWLAFASSQTPVALWLRPQGVNGAEVALSMAHVAAALTEYPAGASTMLPVGAAATRLATDPSALHRLLRRAFQLARTLPNALLQRFETETRGMPRSTEAERLVVQRVGQDHFRGGLLDYWEGRCAITGLAVPELLRASHLKPWRDCAMDAERLDVFNGLLLAPHLDAALDGGLVTLSDAGSLIVSSRLDSEARRLLGLDVPRRLRFVEPRHHPYLAWHREHEFERRLRPDAGWRG